MLTMTETAGDYLSKVLDAANAATEAAVRLSVGNNALSASIDEQRPGDATLFHEGRQVLLLDESASQALDEKTLDVKATPEGRKLTIS